MCTVLLPPGDNPIAVNKYININIISIIIITIPDKRQKSTELKEELTSRWQLNAVCILPLVLSTMGIIPPTGYRIA